MAHRNFKDFYFKQESISKITKQLESELPDAIVEIENGTTTISDGIWRKAILKFDYKSSSQIKLLSMDFKIPKLEAKILIFLSSILLISTIITIAVSIAIGEFLPIAAGIGGMTSILAYNLIEDLFLLQIEKKWTSLYDALDKIKHNNSNSNQYNNPKNHKGKHEYKPNTEKEVKYKENLKEKKIRNDFQVAQKKDTEINDSFYNIIISILISTFISFASYAFLSETRIIDSFQESEFIKNMILVVIFVLSIIFFMFINSKKESIKLSHDNKGYLEIDNALTDEETSTPIKWEYNKQKVTSVLETNYKDLKEERLFTDFEKLKEAADWKKPNYNKGVELCKQQLITTPDFDSTYLVIAEHNILKNKYEEAIACICVGLDNSLRKSYLLSKLGDIYYKLDNPVATMIAYTKSIIASIDTDNLDYVAFLNLAYLFQFSGYENAAIVAKQKSDKLSKKDYQSELDFDSSKVNRLQQIVLDNENQMKSWALKCIKELEENGWSYI